MTTTKNDTFLNRCTIILRKGISGSRLLWLFIFVVVCPSTFAQFRIYPLPRASSPATILKTSKHSVGRSQQLVPRSLPFWDDFSWTQVDKNDDTLSNFPLDSLWVHNYTVWVNSGLGINPPSLNVATFNGLDSAQNPYANQILANGFRDTLTSQPIMLDEVASADRNSVYLSFFYQWYGNGEPPDQNDYLRVDFKNDQGIWESVVTIRPLSSFQNDVFYDTLVKVDGERFFHDNFQFRFMNFGRQSGPYDTWHIDYVYLNKNRSPNDRYLPDRSINSTLTGLFNGYRSVPYHQFLDAVNDPISHPTFDVFNVKNDTSTLSYFVAGRFTNYKGGTPTVTVVDTLGNDGTSPIDGLTGIIYPRERKTVTLDHVPDKNDAGQFDPDADSVAISLKVQLFTGDTFNPKTGQFANDYDPAQYQPLDFRSNDTLRANYLLSDYFAYDDGRAEYAVGLTSFGNRAAYRFELLTPEPDTLIGFDIYYPNYGFISNLTVDFTVYNDVDDLPGAALYTLPSYAIRRNAPNEFQRIRFGEPFLVEGKFYVGWKAPVGGTFRIGLDTNNDSGAKLFVNTNGTWSQNNDVTGSVMIRPVFGGGNIIVGIPEEDNPSQIFPNPNQGSFFVPRNVEVLQIHSVAGQSIPFTTSIQGENQKVQLATTAQGLYLIRMQKSGKLFSAKIVVK